MKPQKKLIDPAVILDAALIKRVAKKKTYRQALLDVGVAPVDARNITNIQQVRRTIIKQNKLQNPTSLQDVPPPVPTLPSVVTIPRKSLDSISLLTDPSSNTTRSSRVAVEAA